MLSYIFCSSNPILKHINFLIVFCIWISFTAGECAVNRQLCSLLTVKLQGSLFSIRPDWGYFPLAETGEVAASTAFDRKWRQVCGNNEWGGVAGVVPRFCACVEGWAMEEQVGVEFPIRVI